MIYGPYSTGWRSEIDRAEKNKRVMWAWVGVVMVLASAGLSVYGVMAF